MKLKHREFAVNGWKFHINDNKMWKMNEFECKYTLLSLRGDAAIPICGVGTAKEARERAQEYYKDYLRWL